MVLIPPIKGTRFHSIDLAMDEFLAFCSPFFPKKKRHRQLFFASLVAMGVAGAVAWCAPKGNP